MPNLGTCSRCTARLLPSLYPGEQAACITCGHVVYDAPPDPTLGPGGAHRESRGARDALAKRPRDEVAAAWAALLRA